MTSSSVPVVICVSLAECRRADEVVVGHLSRSRFGLYSALLSNEIECHRHHGSNDI
jgi:hypothetical protein